MSPPAAGTRAELAEHLVEARIAGDVRTPRESNLRNIRLMLDRSPLHTFGLTHSDAWTPGRVLALLAERVGVVCDPNYTAGADRIDVERTLDALEAAATRLALAGRRRERVLLATGHPTGLLAVHLEVAAALRSAGATVLTPGAGFAYRNAHDEPRHVRHIGGVATVADGAALCHTHSPAAMQGMLEALRADDQPLPDLVVADHGFAGAAGEVGCTVVGFADCNDPALFVGEAEGKVAVCVPLDDNVLPHLYDPVSAYLVRELRAAV